MNYVAVDSDGNAAMRDKARLGKTALQRDALRATRAPLEQFEDRDQHKAFMKMEEMASPFDKTEAGVLQAAWYAYVIQDTVAYNKKVVNRTMTRLIAVMGRTDLRDKWLTAERKAEILKVPSPTNVPTVVKGATHLHPVTKRRVADEVEQVFAELEKYLSVNIRRTVPNLQAAESIANDIAEGEHTFEEYWSWFEQDTWRTEHKAVYANVAKVWESWPQAFVADSGANPLGLSINS